MARIRPLSKPKLFFETLEDRRCAAVEDVCTSWVPAQAPAFPHDRDIAVAIVLSESNAVAPSDSLDSLPVSTKTVTAGQRLVAEIWVQERDLQARGITGGQVDLHFSPAQLRPLGGVNHGSTFTYLPSGVVSTGMVDNLGGATLSPNVGVNPTWARLGSIVFDVLANGPISVKLAKGDLEFAIFGEGNIQWSEVVFSTDSSCVAAEINADQFRIPAGATPQSLDVLANDSLSNGSGRTLGLVSAGIGSQGGTIALAPSKTALIYTPRSGFTGLETFTYIVGDGVSMYSANVQVEVYAPNPWQNELRAEDVNGDGFVTPLDALLVIIELNSRGARSLSGESSTTHYVDVNGDRFVSPLDALLVIIYLNAIGSSAW